MRPYVDDGVPHVSTRLPPRSDAEARSCDTARTYARTYVGACGRERRRHRLKLKTTWTEGGGNRSPDIFRQGEVLRIRPAHVDARLRVAGDLAEVAPRNQGLPLSRRYGELAGRGEGPTYAHADTRTYVRKSFRSQVWEGSPVSDPSGRHGVAPPVGPRTRESGPWVRTYARARERPYVRTCTYVRSGPVGYARTW